MKYLIAILSLALCGCSSTATSKFTFTDGAGATLSVTLPKEMDAKNLSVEINAKEGVATIKADQINSRNVETIRAQGDAASSIATSTGEATSQGLGQAVGTAIKYAK
jgi:hypothetical protein